MSLRPSRKTQESRRAPKSAFLRSSQKSESPATSASPRGSPLRQPFESRTKHVRKCSSSLAESFDIYRLARGRWSASFSRNDSRARGAVSEKFRGAKKRDRKRKKRKKKRNTRDLRAFAAQYRREIRARARRARGAACESRSCVAVDHLVFAAMSNWPGCSGFAEIFPVVRGRWWGGRDRADDDDLRGKRARAGTAQPGAPPSLRSLLPFRAIVRGENGAVRSLRW